ncbi:hypothetical protein MPTK2_3g09580 [Marchantia polymorpha subsp. ruderalis]
MGGFGTRWRGPGLLPEEREREDFWTVVARRAECAGPSALCVYVEGAAFVRPPRLHLLMSTSCDRCVLVAWPELPWPGIARPPFWPLVRKGILAVSSSDSFGLSIDNMPDE